MVIAVPLVLVIGALSAMLIWQGLQPFQHWIVSVINSTDIPFIGRLAHSVMNLSNGVVNATLDWLDGMIGNAAAFITGPLVVVESLFSRGLNAAYGVALALRHAITTIIPREVGQAFAYARTLAVQVEHAVGADFASVERWVTAGITAALATAERYTLDLVNYLTGTINRVVADIDATITSVYRAAMAGITAAETYARDIATDALRIAETDIGKVIGGTNAALGALAGTIATDVAALDGKIDAAITTAIDGSIGVITTDIEHVAQAATVELEHAIDGVIGVAATDFPDIMEWVKSIDLTKALDIAGVTTLSIAGVGALTRYLEECGMPNCRNLSKFGNALSELGTLLGEGAFFALLAYMATDPSGAAETLEPVFGGIASDISAVGKSLLGV